jgi:hypothetical protein
MRCSAAGTVDPPLGDRGDGLAALAGECRGLELFLTVNPVFVGSPLHLLRHFSLLICRRRLRVHVSCQVLQVEVDRMSTTQPAEVGRRVEAVAADGQLVGPRTTRCSRRA